jgi:predicted lipoprotein with Yx(FWY)xxD motif
MNITRLWTMRLAGLRPPAFAISLIISSMAPALTAHARTAPDTPTRVQMTDDGAILVTPSGMTLYTYGPDSGTPGKSQCTNVPVRGFPDPTSGFGTYPLPRADVQKSCAQKWPPYMAGEDAQTGGDWSLIDRAEGGKQWSYRGHPLYTAIKDHKAGDRNGAVRIGQIGIGGRGFNLALAPLNFPPGLKLVRREEGLVLATANDRPVYTPRAARLQKICSGCEELFQPIAAPAVAIVSGDWSVVNTGDGRRQYAYKGKTLYSASDTVVDGGMPAEGGWDTVVFRKSAGMPSEINQRFSLIGDVYTDKAGRTLYVFTCGSPAGDGVRCDDPGDAAEYWAALCGDGKECARRWQPYLAPANARAIGDWSAVDVAYPMFTEATGFTYPPEVPRVKAWAYRGAPVYTYYEDRGPGDIWGHSVRWFALSGFYALQVPGRGVLD